MEPRYHVQFTGRLQTGFSQEQVVANLIKLTNLNRARAESFLASGRPVILKKELDQETAQKYRLAFEKAGLIIRLVKAGTVGNPAPIPPEAPLLPKDSPPQAPASAPENPYAAPKANLTVKKKTTGGWQDEPKKVPASQGWHWLKSAVSMFFERPWVWMGMWLIFFVMVFILNVIPLIGPLCGIILGVILTGGLMLAAQDQSEGKELKVSHVFMGFSHNLNQLFLVGLFYLLFFVAFGILMAVTVGFSMIPFFHAGNPAVAAEAMKNNMPLILTVLVFMALAGIPMMMAYWFAPALAALADKTAWNAYRLSFRACRKNWSAFLVYGLAVFVAGIILTIIFGVLMSVFAVFLLRHGSFLTVLLPMVVMIFLGVPMASILGLTIFTGFRDIYRQAEPARASAAVSK